MITNHNTNQIKIRQNVNKNLKGRMTGLEPANVGSTNQCRNH